jgi:DNA excision repair protein ERCC-3
VDAYLSSGMSGGGVIVLPCGAGKTVVALAIMQKLGKATLFLTPNATSAKQWMREILDKTSLTPEEVGEYTADAKQIRPVTVTTYQMLTHRDGKKASFQHLERFLERDFGFVVYDEVHLLPAPVFRLTADLQQLYDQADARQKYRLAAENTRKIALIGEIVKRHPREQILIIGQYLKQLEAVRDCYGFPLITGTMPQEKREEWYRQFREKEIAVLIVSKVANMAVDLPDASVAIQISGTFGSRQEETQRLGRILRVKEPGKKAHFYHLVTKNTVDQEYAWRRQCYLAEQGYRYEVVEREEEFQ